MHLLPVLWMNCAFVWASPSCEEWEGAENSKWKCINIGIWTSNLSGETVFGVIPWPCRQPISVVEWQPCLQGNKVRTNTPFYMLLSFLDHDGFIYWSKLMQANIVSYRISMTGAASQAGGAHTTADVHKYLWLLSEWVHVKSPWLRK